MNVRGLIDSSNNLIGYRLDLPLGIFDISHEVGKHLGLSSESSIKLYSCDDGMLRSKYEIQNDITYPNISNDFGMRTYISYESGKLSGVDITCGSSLESLTKYTQSFNERFCMKDIDDFIASDCSNLLVLYGVRRTGKTVLIHQYIRNLLRSGISSSKIAYISLTLDSIDSGTLAVMCNSLIKWGIQYLFIDEITYCKGNLNFTSSFSDNNRGSKVILAGTDSAGFLSVLDSVLYDRADVVKTTYISFKEFRHLYQDSTIDDYICVGGLLRSSKDYEKMHRYSLSDYSNFEKHYFRTSIIDNMFNSFRKFDLEERYPNLVNMYYSDKNKLRVLMLKWVQYYAKPLTLKVLRRALMSDDIGNLGDILIRRNISGDIVSFTNRLFDKFKSSIEVDDFCEYNQEDINEVKCFLRDLDCFIEYKPSNLELVLPLAIRYEIATLVNELLKGNHDIVSSIGISLDELEKILQDNIKGVLMEEVFHANLYKSGVDFKKYHKGGLEVDLVIENDAYEIKHSSKVVYEQCKWLIHPDVLSDLNPSSLNVLYNGDDTTVVDTQKHMYEVVIRERKERGMSVPHTILDAYNRSDDKKIVVKYINASKFLLKLVDCHEN